MKNNVYDWVTERIVAQLEKGTIPWRCPWVTGGAPMNFVSKKPYRGFNVFMLACMGYASPYWMSRKQIFAKGGKIRKGEKSTMVIFWKFGDRTKKGVTVRDDNGKPVKSCILRYYNVWNVEQTDGIDYPKPEKTEHDPIEACEAIMQTYKDRETGPCPPITHVGGRAFYRESDDSITMPPMEYFKETPEYYSVLFHEAAHSTGHKSRLGRDLASKGTESYSFEELVAEMTAAMLCGKAGIEMDTLDNSAAYIAGWLKRLKDDTSILIKAAGKAQKAADHITEYEYEASAKPVASVESDKPVAFEPVAQTVAA